MGETMPLISLSYDLQDEELAVRLTEKLRAIGVTVLAEPGADRDRPAIERADGAAARAKAADLVAVLAGSDKTSMAEAMRALRAAAAYNRRVAAARLDPDVSLEASARLGADQRASGDDASAPVFRTFDLFESAGRSYDADEAPAAEGFVYDDDRIEAFVDHLLRAADLGQKERVAAEPDYDDDDVDGYGFPRSPAAMLSRWRLVEPQGDIAELENFLADYSDDRYFAIRAADAIRAARRRAAAPAASAAPSATM